MTQDLRTISIESLRIQIPFWDTTTLFRLTVGIHQEMVRISKYDNKEIRHYKNELVRKASIVENELRERCVSKKITEKRKRGIHIDGMEKIRMHKHFRRWLRDYIESETRKSFYVKKNG